MADKKFHVRRRFMEDVSSVSRTLWLDGFTLCSRLVNLITGRGKRGWWWENSCYDVSKNWNYLVSQTFLKYTWNFNWRRKTVYCLLNNSKIIKEKGTTACFIFKWFIPYATYYKAPSLCIIPADAIQDINHVFCPYGGDVLWAKPQTPSDSYKG